MQKVNNSLSERLRLAAKKIEKLAYVQAWKPSPCTVYNSTVNINTRVMASNSTVDSENAKMRLEVEAARFKM